jgi:hypothetical protein
MKSLVNFMKRFFKLLFGKDVRAELDHKFGNDIVKVQKGKHGLGTVKQGMNTFNDERIIETLEAWEDSFKL